MKPYKPSNQIDKRGWQWLALTSGVGGVALGGFAFATSFVVYLIIILPVLLGLVAGLLLREAVYRGKVRNPLIASIFAVLMGTTLYGTMHGANYLLFRQNATQEISRSLKSGDKSKSNSAGMTIDQFLQEKTGVRGFRGFMQYRSQTGIVIKRSLFSIPVPPQITWNYWGLEFLITSAIAAGFAFGAAKKPFCESCHSWYSSSDRLGRVQHQHLPEFLEAINQEAAEASASKFLAPLAKIYPPSLEVHLHHCASCQSSKGILTLSQAGVNRNGVIKFTPYSQGTISPEQSVELTQAIREQVAQQISQHISLKETSLGESTGELTDKLTNESTKLEPSQLLPQISLAQQERSIIDKKSNQKSIYTNHNLSLEQLTDIQQQLAKYPQIKQAYLVQKVVQILPEIPFYVLGIIRKKHIIESATAQTEWESKFGNELEFWGDFAVVILNGDRRLQKKFQQIEDSAIYTYTPPTKPLQPALPSEL